MTITTTDTVERYVGDGSQTAWPITFPFFTGEDVKACIVNSSGEQVNLVYGTDYTVTKSISSIGGTLNYALADEVTLTIWLSLPITQGTDFYNTGPLNAEVLEVSFDRLTLIAQQLKELIDRAILVPVTSPDPPEILAERIFEAEDLSARYATIAEEAKNVVLLEKDTVLSTISSTGTAQIGAITGEGNAQVARLENLSNLGGLTDGLACRAKVISVSSAIEADTPITASDIFYVVGRNHLRVFCDGIALSSTFFTEIGEVDTLSRSFSVTFDLEAGQELELWISPLGHAELTSALTRLSALEDDLAELSRKVVYAEANSN